MSLESYMLREVDVEKLKELGFVEGNKVIRAYQDLYQLYTILLTKYVDKRLNLSEREKEIIDHPLHLEPVKEEDQDSYQSLSPLKFFFIRNNLKLERIPKETLQILKKRCENKNFELDAISEQIIEDTYREVITNKKYDEGTNINYGPTTSSDFFAPNNYIVLGLRRDPEYEKDNGKDDSWLDDFMKKEMIIEALKNQIIKEATEKNLPLSVIVYNEATVTKSKEPEIKK